MKKPCEFEEKVQQLLLTAHNDNTPSSSAGGAEGAIVMPFTAPPMG